MELKFDQDGARLYFNGVDHCALFVKTSEGYAEGVAWNGISNATVTPEGGDANDIYADNIKYLSIPGAVNINASITAYTYPDAFNNCMGLGKTSDGKADAVLFANQERKKFGLVYRSKIGNDVSDDYGYVLNILYNCLASPTELSSDTVNESPEAAELSFDITTVAVAESDMPKGLKPTSWVRIECKRGGLLDNDGKETEKLKELLAKLYGTDPEGEAKGTAPTLITPAAIYDMLKDTTTNPVVDGE